MFPLLDASLRALPPQAVTVQGQWATTARRTHASGDQSGTGEGPFIEITDSRWIGTVSCASEVGAIAFLLAKTRVHWSKAPLISSALLVQVTLSAYTDHDPRGATFSAAIGGAYLPGVPVTAGAGASPCSLGPTSFVTGRVTCLAEASDAAFLVVVFPRLVLKVGRNHLWRLRDDVAAPLPPAIRTLLTRGRSGAVPASLLTG